MKTIIEMAQDAGWKDLRDYDTEMHNDIFMGNTDSLKRFAELAADAEAKRIHDEGMVTVGHMREKISAAVLEEREACAQLAAKKLWAGEIIAKYIRARSDDAP